MAVRSGSPIRDQPGRTSVIADSRVHWSGTTRNANFRRLLSGALCMTASCRSERPQRVDCALSLRLRAADQARLGRRRWCRPRM